MSSYPSACNCLLVAMLVVARFLTPEDLTLGTFPRELGSCPFFTPAFFWGAVFWEPQCFWLFSLTVVLLHPPIQLTKAAPAPVPQAPPQIKRSKILTRKLTNPHPDQLPLLFHPVNYSGRTQNQQPPNSLSYTPLRREAVHLNDASFSTTSLRPS